MLARADSSGILGPSTRSPAAFPAWARPEKPPENQAEAAFLAGAALARLDAVVRGDPPFAGALRRRLALRAAAACVARSGRAEDEGALRDAVQFTAPGADAGPAGRQVLAWRALAAGPAAQWRRALFVAAEALRIPQDAGLEEVIEAAAGCLKGVQAGPFAAAEAFAIASRVFSPSAEPRSPRRTGEGALIAAWFADSVLAQKLNWPFAMPLLGAALFAGSGQRAPGASGEGDETTRILSAYAQAAGQACDLAAQLGRRAQKLQETAPRLRAKGAAAALAALLDDDCLSAATRIKGLSERGARRLFERLVSLSAIRELTGRNTFRLYGL
jgi:Protein of unknown function (DUF1403)